MNSICPDFSPHLSNVFSAMSGVKLNPEILDGRLISAVMGEENLLDGASLIVGLERHYLTLSSITNMVLESKKTLPICSPFSHLWV